MVKSVDAKSLAIRLLNPKKNTQQSIGSWIINEPVAIRKRIQYIETKMKIKKSELIVSKEHPYLAVSPDRLLRSNCLIEMPIYFTKS